MLKAREARRTSYSTRVSEEMRLRDFPFSVGVEKEKAKLSHIISKGTIRRLNSFQFSRYES